MTLPSRPGGRIMHNPVYRGMQQRLMNAFDQIYIMDLHGNAKKKERCPDGSKDENVFDIQQGVAIALMLKLPEGAKRKKGNPTTEASEP